MKRSLKSSYIFLGKWILLAFLGGISGCFIVRSFIILTGSISTFLSTVPVPIFLWSILGAAVTGGILYKFEPHAAGEGIPAYIRDITKNKGIFSFSVTFFKYWSACATIATFGNGGILGPLGRVSAGIMSFFSGKCKRLCNPDDVRTASICGLAAVTGSIFQSSIGGGIFAVEIIQRAKLGYKDIFPAILASTIAVFISKAFGWKPFYGVNTVNQFMDLHKIGILLLLTIVSGAVGGLYIKTYTLVSKIFKRAQGNVFLKVLLGSFFAAVCAWLINPELLGTSGLLLNGILSMNEEVLYGSFGNSVPIVLILIILLLGKALFSSVTVGSGMSAGFTGPAVIMGILLGSVFSNLFGIQPGSPTYYAFLAAGFSGVLASSMNIPLAAAIMTVEIFGPSYSLPGALAAIVGFQVTRAQTIYDYALIQPDLDQE